MALTVAATATILACSDSYEDAVAPSVDAGPAASPANASPPEKDSAIADASQPIDASDADAEIDAGYNPCDAGYEPGTSGVCQIANPFRNPSFDGDGGWNTREGAQILPTIAGPDDLGVARIRDDALSYLGGVDQTITLASGLADVPLAIHFVAEITAPTGGDFVGFPAFGIYSDGFPIHDWTYGLRPGGAARAALSLCLGEATLFGPHDISFHALADYYDRVDLDLVTLISDPQCPPARAGIRNGNFETTAGWDMTSGIVYENGSGVGGSRGLRFTKPISSTSAAVHQLVSVPSVSIATPALSFHVLGAGVFHVVVDDHLIARRQTTGTDETVTICMPEWSRGTIVDLALSSGGDELSLEGPELDQTFVIDDMSFVSSPGCAQTAVLANGDFENADANMPGWYLNAGFGNSFGRVTGDAHGGNGFLRLASTSDSCTEMGGAIPVALAVARMPEYDSVKGPRVSFWYRFDPGLSATAELVHYGTLDPAATWTQKTFCLEKEAVGTREELRFYLSTRSSPCSSSSLDIDDVVVDVDGTCAQ
jgi:hypothetical protein